MVTPSSKCFKLPTPPLAMTGIFKISLALLRRPKSKPSLVPSLSIEVNNISPAPNCCNFSNHDIALIPVFLVPPCEYTIQSS